MEERSPPSQSTSDSCSSLSRSSTGSRSPRSQTPSDSRSSLSRDDTQRFTETQPKASSSEHKQKRKKTSDGGRGEEEEELDLPDTVDSAVSYRKEKQRHNSGPKVCKDDRPEHEQLGARGDSESVQLLEKAEQCWEEDHKRKRREDKNMDVDSGKRGGNHSDSMQDVERQKEEKTHKETSRGDAERDRNPGSSRSSESRSEKDRKQQRDDVQTSCAQVPNGNGQKTEIVEAPKICNSDSKNLSDRTKEEKKETKSWPRAEGKIWEGAVKLKPQMKISIILDAKGKKESTEKQEQYNSESITSKAEGESQSSDNGPEEQLNPRGTEAEVNENQQKETSRDQEHVSEEQMKPDKEESRAMWEEVPLRDNKRQREEEKEEADLWHCAFRRGEEEEEKMKSKKQRKERHRVEASKGEEPTRDGRRSVSGGSLQEEWKTTEKMEGGKRRMKKEEAEAQRSRKSHSEGPNTMVEDVRSEYNCCVS